MNYLISAYSVNPYKGSEDSIGWNWVLQYEKNYKEGDRIILLTKKFNEKDTRRGLKEFNSEKKQRYRGAYEDYSVDFSPNAYEVVYDGYYEL